jgi:hypothetical protein
LKAKQGKGVIVWKCSVSYHGAGKVKATYKDGVLKIDLPKTKEAAVKKIEVKAA